MQEIFAYQCVCDRHLPRLQLTTHTILAELHISNIYHDCTVQPGTNKINIHTKQMTRTTSQWGKKKLQWRGVKFGFKWKYNYWYIIAKGNGGLIGNILLHYLDTNMKKTPYSDSIISKRKQSRIKEMEDKNNKNHYKKRRGRGVQGRISMSNSFSSNLHIGCSIHIHQVIRI